MSKCFKVIAAILTIQLFTVRISLGCDTTCAIKAISGMLQGYDLSKNIVPRGKMRHLRVKSLYIYSKETLESRENMLLPDSMLQEIYITEHQRLVTGNLIDIYATDSIQLIVNKFEKSIEVFTNAKQNQQIPLSDKLMQQKRALILVADSISYREDQNLGILELHYKPSEVTGYLRSLVVIGYPKSGYLEQTQMEYYPQARQYERVQVYYTQSTENENINLISGPLLNLSKLRTGQVPEYENYSFFDNRQ
jgi:hypothetical protein